jgi:16S rRNA processing protein RimM
MQVTVGRIGRPHGIRGDVVVGVRTDEPERRFAAGSRLDTDRADIGTLTVAATRWQSGELIVRFDGIRDRDAAAEFRDHELIGLSVSTADGTVVGVVTDVLHPGQDLLAVRPAEGSREILVPFVKAIVTDVDVAAGVLVIDPPPGLLNLEEAP